MILGCIPLFIACGVPQVQSLAVLNLCGSLAPTKIPNLRLSWASRMQTKIPVKLYELPKEGELEMEISECPSGHCHGIRGKGLREGIGHTIRQSGAFPVTRASKFLSLYEICLCLGTLGEEVYASECELVISKCREGEIV
ncbi:hypothetical protein CPB85DRAFT_902590 [Mucidula mucida]|nr:hypothetical protein CPB85DRAFT_902590 [Mucidula mucida]